VTAFGDAWMATALAAAQKTRRPDPGQGSRRAPFGMGVPSDPRSGTVPRGSAGWAERGDQEGKAADALPMTWAQLVRRKR
jgi:hypothetical protein